jgi:hypothetical protein
MACRCWHWAKQKWFAHAARQTSWAAIEYDRRPLAPDFFICCEKHFR